MTPPEACPTRPERIRRSLADDLAPGLTVTEPDSATVPGGPELDYLLTVELSWTVAQHRPWLTEAWFACSCSEPLHRRAECVATGSTPAPAVIGLRVGAP